MSQKFQLKFASSGVLEISALVICYFGFLSESLTWTYPPR